MATILLTWELGSGLGHLLPLRVVGQALVARGHRVVAALREFGKAEALLAGTGISYIQAPIATRKGRPPFEKMSGFAHILANAGFADGQTLAESFAAWNALFDAVNPDLVVTDHSPTALLALRGRKVPVANLGLAFYCPPDTFPLPHWTKKGHTPGHLQMADDERPLTENVNRVLRSNGRPTLERLGQLFNDLDEVMIATYKEFDPFGVRQGKRYWGHWHAGGGVEPVWPSGSGPKVFAYLKPFPAIDALLLALRQAGVPSIILAGEIADELQQRHGTATLRFEKQPLDLSKVAQQCDLGITNAGHGTTVSMLMAGKPLLLFPLYVEQLMNAQAVARLGAGKWIMAQDHESVGSALRAMLSSDQFREGARRFADRYRGFDPGSQISEIVERLEKIVSRC